MKRESPLLCTSLAVRHGLLDKLYDELARYHTVDRRNTSHDILPNVVTSKYNSLPAMFLTQDSSHCFTRLLFVLNVASVRRYNRCNQLARNVGNHHKPFSLFS